MFISVAICSFNRAESLRRTLGSVTGMHVPSDLAWEVIVVNNNSTDHTDDVIAEYQGRLPIRREFEPRPGHSNARNRAIDVAKGEYIVWTDDDVVVDPEWLKTYAEAFQRWPEASVFGGRITPRFERPVAKWVMESESLLRDAYALRDFGNNVQPLSVAENRLPFGANFAIRATEQRKFRYDPNLGLAPKRWRFGDETEIITRILKSGEAGYWLPDAVVEHCIGQEKQTVRYIANYCAGVGETEAYRSPTTPHFQRRVWPLKSWFRYRLHRLVSPPPVWVMYLQTYAYYKGVYRFGRQQKR
jgi:glycosyltransferase involved in cell wall biosynthesis